MSSIDRRRLLAALPALALGLGTAGRLGAQNPKERTGAADPLQNPDWVGRPRDVVDSADNNGIVTSTERRLRCTCGCGLDVFTCRTTDFTCTYSPALHREVMALVLSGKTADQVVEAFVAKYSETILMAPKEQGFGVVGYWLPASALALAGGLLAWVLVRRFDRSAAAPVPARSAPPAPPAELNAAERARLDQALRDIPR